MVPYTGDLRMGLIAVLLILLSVGASGGAFIATLIVKNLIRKLKKKAAENRKNTEESEKQS